MWTSIELVHRVEWLAPAIEIAAMYVVNMQGNVANLTLIKFCLYVYMYKLLCQYLWNSIILHL